MGDEENSLPEIIAKAGTYFYQQAKTKVGVRSELYEELHAQYGVQQGYVVCPLVLAIAVDVLTQYSREGSMNEVLYANNLVMIDESTKSLKEVFQMKRGNRWHGVKG